MDWMTMLMLIKRHWMNRSSFTMQNTLQFLRTKSSIITKCYADITRSNATILAVSMLENDRLQMLELTKRAPKAFQLLVSAAATSYRQTARASSVQPARGPLDRRARSVSVESQSSHGTAASVALGNTLTA